MSQAASIAEALQGACNGEGEQITVDLDAFERLLKRAKVRVEKANKAVLNAELQATREEVRVQKTRASNSPNPSASAKRISELEEHEAELVEQLWPSKEAT